MFELYIYFKYFYVRKIYLDSEILVYSPVFIPI
jgi:hypothetical protein